MKITEINIDEKHIFNDLKPIYMNRLNQCVVIAGKNGSGKSRLLSTITSIITKKPNKMTVDNCISQLKSFEQFIANSYKKIEEYKRQQHLNTSQKQYYDNHIAQEERNIDNFTKQIEQFNQTINWPLIKTNNYYDNYNTISFVPKDLRIKDNRSFNKNDLDSYADTAYQIGLSNMSHSAYAYIQKIQEKWFNATHPLITINEDEKNKAINTYKQLNEILNSFLGCEISRDKDGNATIFNFPLAASNLSDGQKVILQYCVAIHAQGATLDEHILILDEPENHLHPSILINVIEKIRSINKNGQIWIATHSIPLLSYFDPQDIWFMEEGLISKDGKIPEKVLNGLLGKEEQIEKMKDFISLPAVQAINKYAFEALFPPLVADTGSNDSQTIQIHREISKYIKPNGKIKILDYGAGKGRILNGIEDRKESFIDQVEYYAYDEYPKYKNECINAISHIYNNAEERYFSNENELKSKHDEHTFDIIIMCNVLHEIDPNDWFDIFGTRGIVTRMLKKIGILMLVEDHQLPHGEKAYQNGFIVLDTPEIKKLFNISSEDENFSYDDFRGDGRLKAHRIPQPYLEQITEKTRNEALNDLANRALKEITSLRKSEEKNYKNGRLSGFWLHQFANAKLALSKLTN